jgi:hypothetical protein
VPPEECSAKSRLAEYLRRREPGPLTEAEWTRLRAALAPATAGYLRRLLRASGVPLDPLVEGVRQDAFDGLERTLAALAGEYETARSAGDLGRQAACRAVVIQAKDHARFSMARTKDPGVAARKREMVEWMLVWLGNPSLFSAWVALRKRCLAGSR